MKYQLHILSSVLQPGLLPMPAFGWRSFYRSGSAKHIARRPTTGRHAMCRRSAHCSVLLKARPKGLLPAPQMLFEGAGRRPMSIPSGWNGPCQDRKKRYLRQRHVLSLRHAGPLLAPSITLEGPREGLWGLIRDWASSERSRCTAHATTLFGGKDVPLWSRCGGIGVSLVCFRLPQVRGIIES